MSFHEETFKMIKIGDDFLCFSKPKPQIYKHDVLCHRFSWRGKGGAFPQILGWMLSDGLVWSDHVATAQSSRPNYCPSPQLWTCDRAESDSGLQRNDRNKDLKQTGTSAEAGAAGGKCSSSNQWAGFLAFFILALKVEDSVRREVEPPAAWGWGAERKTVQLPSSSGQLQKLFHGVCLHSFCKHFIILQRQGKRHRWTYSSWTENSLRLTLMITGA